MESTMKDIKTLTDTLMAFGEARGWHKYYSPKNLTLSVMIELGELMEHFQWKSDEEIMAAMKDKPEPIEEELADIAIYLFELARTLGIDDFATVIEKKIVKNAIKYPEETTAMDHPNKHTI